MAVLQSCVKVCAVICALWNIEAFLEGQSSYICNYWLLKRFLIIYLCVCYLETLWYHSDYHSVSEWCPVFFVCELKHWINRWMGGWTHRQVRFVLAVSLWSAVCRFQSGQSTPLLSAAVTLLCGRSPCQVFQAHSQKRGSGGLEACSLVKYLNYVIDVSTVINFAAAHPSSWPVPTRLHGALWRSCQTGPDEVCVCVCLFDCLSLLFW